MCGLWLGFRFGMGVSDVDAGGGVYGVCMSGGRDAPFDGPG